METADVTIDASDVVVIGCGPAGSAASLLLGRWGYGVTLLSRTAPTPRDLVVSLPPSCKSPLAATGLLGAVDSAGFMRTTGNTSWWGGEERIAPFAKEAYGYQARKSELEAVVSDAARAEGVDLRTGCVVRRVDLPADDGPEGVVVHYVHGGRPKRLDARWIVDASGRTGVLARQLGLRRDHPSAVTLAVMAPWTSTDWGLEHLSHTLVESYTDGWAWSVPTSPARRHFTVMLDARLSERASDAEIEDLYATHLARARHLADLSHRGERSGPASACRASVYDSDRYAGPGYVLAGDAASFIDPLSSYGVKKALASGWLAAVVVNTCLSRPSASGPALELHAERERMAFAAFQDVSRSFASQAGDAHAHPFWEGRTDWPAAIQTGDGLASTPDPDVQALKQDPRVVAAFEALRLAPEVRLRRADGCTLVDRPRVRADQVILDPQVFVPASSFTARYLRGVDLVSLLALAPKYNDMGELYESYCRLSEPVILPDFMGALSVLVGMGALNVERLA